MKFKFDISVILVNFNSSHHTLNCINSIKRNTDEKINYEIIIVDNGSNPQDLSFLSQNINESNNLKLIKNRLNTGFAQGNMTGINRACGKYLYILNNDCIILNDVLSKLMNFMETHSEAACCVPKMYNKDGTLTPAFQNLPSISSKWLGNKFLSKINKTEYPDKNAEYSDPIKIPVASGASMFVDTKLFYSIGGLDTNFFLYLEEEDLCLRFKNAGLSVYHVPSAEIKHLGGESTQRSLEIAREYYISLWYYLNKNCSFIERFFIKLRYIIRELCGTIRNPQKLKLAIFLLLGAPMKYSLKHRQKLSEFGMFFD
jgi:GT2 family glycosyltransferase